MPLLPDFLKRFQNQIKKNSYPSIENSIEFSKGTYQVLTIDPKTKDEIWVFLQLDLQGRITDSFCPCENHENKKGCIHQAIAFLRVYGDYNIPLHLRFDRSLWNHLCFWSASELDDFSSDRFIEQQDQIYSCFQGDGHLIFSIKGKTQYTKEFLKKFLFNRETPTEENSLKFSNLSPKELKLWERGTPSKALQYELSIWSDLAKYILLQQETKQPYQITFQETTSSEDLSTLPLILHVEFPEFSLEWHLSKPGLLAIIPTLSTVNSPLKINYQSTTGIAHIQYIEEKHCFIPEYAGEVKQIEGTHLGNWVYIPQDGFYSETHLSQLNIADLADVEKSLIEHYDTIKALLIGCKIRETSVTKSYSLSFDAKNNLHIQGYLLTPGDLKHPKSHIFGSWIYLHSQGFYHVEECYFKDIETVIPAIEVADFVVQHRTWLNTQDGFSTHMTPIEADLIYRLSEEKTLSFSRNVSIQNNAGNIDFNRWIYVEGQGFYSKTSLQTNLPLNSSSVITESQIPIFIRRNHEELQLVQNFFSNRSPVSKSRVNIYLVDSNKIIVKPEYELFPLYQDKKVQFFGDFTYVETEGFFELPISLRLPERFSHEVVIEGKEIVPFVKNDLSALLPIANFVDPRLKSFEGRILVKNIDCKDDDEMRTYNLKLMFETELGTLSIASLWNAYKKGEKFICSDAGLIDLDDKQFSWLKQLSKRQVNTKKETLLLSSLEVLKLNATQNISLSTPETDNQEKAWEIFHELTELKMPTDPDCTGLKSQLRPYQIAGIKWLWFLYHHGLSGLLCDDMGLGKTHQAMALLMASINERRKNPKAPKLHSLVICPTSVIYHWQEKLNTFLPDLRVWTFHGAKRSLDQFYEESDLLLTSYGIWRNEINVLSKLKFDIAIFDELQIAKNQSSRIYKTLLKAKAKMRLGMTGTPIENYLRELKSLFDLILPNYFPKEEDFRTFFTYPIEKEGNKDRKQLLSRLIKPFVLRRKKQDVLFDLPEKIEEISHCELSEEQRLLYETTLTKSRERLLNDLENEEAPVPYIHVFALLAHLKQICNHPAVYLKTPNEYKKYSSGKWDLFVELLEEARESGQKIVVFSQYLTMIDIIENYLKEHDIGYASIRGSTTNRGEQLKMFSDDPKCEVFVASLQAAGLGIDLTAASVVIHYDRWWNAAKENQATDRVHRIGQKRGVQVFKLMTKNTLEEHINFLIAKKGRLMEDIVSVDDQQIIKQLDRKEIIALLKMNKP